MSVGNLKDQGNQGKNFPFQLGALKVLGSIKSLVASINSLVTKTSEVPVASITYNLGTADTVINPDTIYSWTSGYKADIVVIEVVNTTAGDKYIRYDLYDTFLFANRTTKKQLSEGDVLKLIGIEQLKKFYFSDELALSGGYVNFTLYQTQFV
jgi:hypothetical protein